MIVKKIEVSSANSFALVEPCETPASNKRLQNGMIDGENLFNKRVKNDMRTSYGNIRKMAIGQENDYSAGSLLDYLSLFILLKSIIR